MRSQIGLVNPALRTKHVGYIVPKKVYRQKGGFLPLLFLPSLVGGLGAASVASSIARKQGGSGVIEDADKIYQQTLLGNGLRLAGQGVNLAGQGIGVAGGGLNLAGHGVGVAGGGLGDLPAGMLRMNLLDNQIKQSSDRNYGSEYAVGSGKHKMKGRGQDALGDIQNALYDVVSAGLHKMGVGQLIPDTLVKSVIKSATKKAGNTVKDVIVNLSKKILPIITKTHLAQTGNGMAYEKVVKSKKYDKLHGKLGRYIASEYMGQDGGDFFSDFADGFMSVIKPFASIAGPVASALFPEFSPAISAVTGLINKA